MEQRQKVQAHLDRQHAVISQLGPTLLIIGLDDRLLLGKRPLEADIAVQVAVGDVVGDLPKRPASRAVRRVELLFGQPAESRTHLLRQQLNLADPKSEISAANRAVVPKLANRVAEVCHLQSGWGVCLMIVWR